MVKGGNGYGFTIFSNDHDFTADFTGVKGTFVDSDNWINYAPAQIFQTHWFEGWLMDFELWREKNEGSVLTHLGVELTYGTVDNAYIFLTGFGHNRRGLSGKRYYGDQGAEKGLDGLVTIATFGSGKLVKETPTLLKSGPKLWNGFRKRYKTVHGKATLKEHQKAYRELLTKNHHNYHSYQKFKQYDFATEQIGRYVAAYEFYGR